MWHEFEFPFWFAVDSVVLRKGDKALNVKARRHSQCLARYNTPIDILSLRLKRQKKRTKNYELCPTSGASSSIPTFPSPSGLLIGGGAADAFGDRCARIAVRRFLLTRRLKVYYLPGKQTRLRLRRARAATLFASAVYKVPQIDKRASPCRENKLALISLSGGATAEPELRCTRNEVNDVSMAPQSQFHISLSGRSAFVSLFLAQLRQHTPIAIVCTISKSLASPAAAVAAAWR